MQASESGKTITGFVVKKGTETSQQHVATLVQVKELLLSILSPSEIDEDLLVPYTQVPVNFVAATERVDAVNTLTFHGFPLADATITIGEQTYTWVANVTQVGDVQVAESAADAARNLFRCLTNAETGQGVTHMSATVSPVVDVVIANDIDLVVTCKNAVEGVAGNALVTTSSVPALASWLSPTCYGGADAVESSLGTLAKTGRLAINGPNVFIASGDQLTGSTSGNLWMSLLTKFTSSYTIVQPGDSLEVAYANASSGTSLLVMPGIYVLQSPLLANHSVNIIGCVGPEGQPLVQIYGHMILGNSAFYANFEVSNTYQLSTLATSNENGLFCLNVKCLAAGAFNNPELNCFGTYVNCVGDDNAFGYIESGGIYKNCTAGDSSFGGTTFSGIATRCEAGENSFGAYACTGKLMYCYVNFGTFNAVSEGGWLRWCVNADGSDPATPI